MFVGSIDAGRIDASVLEAVASPAPTQQRLSVSAMRQRTEQHLQMTLAKDSAGIAPLQIHQAIRSGLPGSSMVAVGSLVYDTIDDITAFFETTPKTLRERVKQPRLRTDESERVMRMGRIMVAAHQALGSFDAARQYLRTSNFALGGTTPLELMQTAEGERVVLDELQAHAEGGPL